jgi:hypothetical protein
MLVT